MRLALFIPCFVEHLHPEVGLATARLLDRLELDWIYPEAQTCCGQPAFNAGHPGECLDAARHFLSKFRDFDTVVAPSGSCVAMVRRYSSLDGFSHKEGQEFEELAARIFELSDFLVNQLQVVDVGASFKIRGTIQDSCHTLRELGISDEPRQLLNAVRGLELVDQAGLDCCGFGGVYSVKMPELSILQADDRLEAAMQARCESIIGTEPSCLMHLQARADHRKLPIRTLHLAELLAGENDEG
jgi:L-lactate dehydrogenase complex protein LldE